jgi:dephospho-CoA kinase
VTQLADGVFDADWQQAKAEFGDAVIGQDGALDRARMRELVFSDPDARKRLESILHPVPIIFAIPL